VKHPVVSAQGLFEDVTKFILHVLTKKLIFVFVREGRQREELEDGFPMENKTLPRDCFLSHKPFIERSLHAVLIISVACS
jgi:hypothetical protein